jgi:chaperonin GroES
MSIRPLDNRVLIEPLAEETTSPGGIVLPEKVKEKPMEGKVCAVGPGKLLDDGTRKPVEISVGDKVLFGKYAGTEVKHDGKDLIIMREDDVMGIIE